MTRSLNYQFYYWLKHVRTFVFNLLRQRKSCRNKKTTQNIWSGDKRYESALSTSDSMWLSYWWKKKCDLRKGCSMVRRVIFPQIISRSRALHENDSIYDAFESCNFKQGVISIYRSVFPLLARELIIERKFHCTCFAWQGRLCFVLLRNNKNNFLLRTFINSNDALTGQSLYFLIVRRHLFMLNYITE